MTDDIDSELSLLADDCVCYRGIKDSEDMVQLQVDIDHLGCWARSWGMSFQAVKCNIMQGNKEDYKETDQEDQCFLYLRENGPR